MILVSAVSGFLARDVDTVVLITKLLFDQGHLYQYDPELVPIPWNEQVEENENYKTSLKSINFRSAVVYNKKETADRFL